MHLITCLYGLFFSPKLFASAHFLDASLDLCLHASLHLSFESLNILP